MRNTVLVAATISNTFQQFLEQQPYAILPFAKAPYQPAEIIGVVTSTKIIIDKKFIDTHANLQWIARMGSGMEIIDEAYCQQKNIFVCNAPKGIAKSVAEHALAMLVGLQKNIFTSSNEVANGQWIREPNRGWELENLTVGLIGYGNTAQAFAKLLSVFKVQVLAFDVDWANKALLHKNLRKASLKEIEQQADIVSYHVPLKTDTVDYYNADAFSKKHILINTSRGPNCSTKNILAGFASGQLTGACLDVLDFENVQPFGDNEMMQLKKLLAYNCIITPHIAGYSFNAIENMCAELQEKLASFL